MNKKYYEFRHCKYNYNISTSTVKRILKHENLKKKKFSQSKVFYSLAKKKKYKSMLLSISIVNIIIEVERNQMRTFTNQSETEVKFTCNKKNYLCKQIKTVEHIISH